MPSFRSDVRSLLCLLILSPCTVFPSYGQDYTLSVEASPAIAPSLTTYRFYVNMVNATDRMSAVFGIVGCTNPEACNYDAAANINDDSCEFADAGYDCDGDGVCDAF